MSSGRPILVAVRAGAEPEPALAAAAALAQHWGAPVEALSVVEPLASFAAGAEVAGLLQDEEQQQLTTVRPRLHAHVTQVAGAVGASWEIRAEVGPAPEVIARRAVLIDARLVVTGLGRHALMDRLFGSETAVRALRLLERPLLAVATAVPVPARHAVVATDFSPASQAAAREALALLAPGGRLTLVHVAASHAPTPAPWQEAAEQVIPRLFAEQVQGLAVPAGVAVDTVARTGEPVAELLAVAAAADASFVAAGRHGLRALERLLLGSTTTALLRRSDRAVLVATGATSTA